MDCHFLRIPAEIRVFIYRELLVPVRPVRFINPDYDDRLHLYGTSATIHTEILRTNIQIYNEAVGILYSEVTIVVLPGDIMSLRRPPEDIPGAQACTNLWGYNALDPVRAAKAWTRILHYRMGEIDGMMDPHVFSRFENIAFYGYFNTAKHSMEDIFYPALHVKDNLKVLDYMPQRYFFRQFNVFRDFAFLLSKSPTIRSLLIDLRFKIQGRRPGHPPFGPAPPPPPPPDDFYPPPPPPYYLPHPPPLGQLAPASPPTPPPPPNWPPIVIIPGPPSQDSSAESESEEEEDDENGYMNVIEAAKNETMRTFLLMGALDPFRKLPQVENFNFEAKFVDQEGRFYELAAKHSEMIRDLKGDIELTGSFSRKL